MWIEFNKKLINFTFVKAIWIEKHKVIIRIDAESDLYEMEDFHQEILADIRYKQLRDFLNDR